MIDIANQVGPESFSVRTGKEVPAAQQNCPSREASLLAFARFGAGVVHEINNPLAVALLSAQLALRSFRADMRPGAERSLERAIETIRIAANAVRETIRRCSESNAESYPFDIRDVLRFATLVMKSHCEQHGCVLVWDISRDVSVVSGNPIELEIALANLIYGVVADGARDIRLSSEVRESIISIQLVCTNVRTPPNDDTTQVTDSSDADLRGMSIATGADELIQHVISSAGGAFLRTEQADGGQIVTISLPKHNHQLNAHENA